MVGPGDSTNTATAAKYSELVVTFIFQVQMAQLNPTDVNARIAKR